MGNLEEVLGNAWRLTRQNIRTCRYLHPTNYISDIVAGNISRTPLYAAFDNTVIGVSDEQALNSAVNSLVISSLGWSLAYVFGNSILATSLGETYQKHAKKIDAAYSAAMTFGFGMAVNLMAGYDVKEAFTASLARAAMAIPLGPVTRYYTDSFRQMRGEQAIAKDTRFKDKDWKYSLQCAAVMILLPISFASGILMTTPAKYREVYSTSPSAIVAVSSDQEKFVE